MFIQIKAKSLMYLDYNTDRSIQGVLHLDEKNILMYVIVE